jgi:hypothetical protein
MEDAAFSINSISASANCEERRRPGGTRFPRGNHLAVTALVCARFTNKGAATHFSERSLLRKYTTRD